MSPTSLLAAHMVKLRDDHHLFSDIILKPKKPPQAPDGKGKSITAQHITAQQVYESMVAKNDEYMALPAQSQDVMREMKPERKRVWIKTMVDIEALAAIGAAVALA